MDISTIISGVSLLIVFLTFVIGRTKDRDMAKEQNIKTNVKLDQLCTNTNQILIKQEKHEGEIQNVKTEIAVLKRDVKALKEEINERKH